jgi:hypothetical protein
VETSKEACAEYSAQAFFMLLPFEIPVIRKRKRTNLVHRGILHLSPPTLFELDLSPLNRGLFFRPESATARTPILSVDRSQYWLALPVGK